MRRAHSSMIMWFSSDLDWNRSKRRHPGSSTLRQPVNGGSVDTRSHLVHHRSLPACGGEGGDRCLLVIGGGGGGGYNAPHSTASRHSSAAAAQHSAAAAPVAAVLLGGLENLLGRPGLAVHLHGGDGQTPSALPYGAGRAGAREIVTRLTDVRV